MKKTILLASCLLVICCGCVPAANTVGISNISDKVHEIGDLVCERLDHRVLRAIEGKPLPEDGDDILITYYNEYVAVSEQISAKAAFEDARKTVKTLLAAGDEKE